MQVVSSSLLFFGAYLLGSVPFALGLGRALGVDIRQTGSGNVGATNLARAVGRKWGIVAFLLDYTKGLLPTLVALSCDAAQAPAFALAGTGWLPVLTGAAAVLGHVFPVYLRFRGGKGVATAFGVMTALCWPATLVAGCIWIVLFLTTRTVSIASIAAALALPAAVPFVPHSSGGALPAVQAFAIALALFLVARHRSNILRLSKGEELRFR